MQMPMPAKTISWYACHPAGLTCSACAQTATKAKQVEERLGFHLGSDVTAHELVQLLMAHVYFV